MEIIIISLLVTRNDVRSVVGFSGTPLVGSHRLSLRFEEEAKEAIDGAREHALLDEIFTRTIMSGGADRLDRSDGRRPWVAFHAGTRRSSFPPSPPSTLRKARASRMSSRARDSRWLEEHLGRVERRRERRRRIGEGEEGGRSAQGPAQDDSLTVKRGIPEITRVSEVPGYFNPLPFTPWPLTSAGRKRGKPLNVITDKFEPATDEWPFGNRTEEN
ncbi:hypothetical protein KM043_002644 [Ampulex compressa]|nr:hypothetical protein KM043_002644 [Ampulex compressa]